MIGSCVSPGLVSGSRSSEDESGSSAMASRSSMASLAMSSGALSESDLTTDFPANQT